MRHNGYRGRICRSVGYSLVFFSYFLLKDKIPLTHRRSSKYYAGQEIRIGPPESSGVRKREIPKSAMGKRVSNSIYDGERGILQRLSCSGAQGIKA